MKLQELEQIIYETVKKAVREEVRDILLESTGNTVKAAPKKVREQEPEPDKMSSNIIGSLLQETFNTMKPEDYKGIYSDSTQTVEGDLPPFARNAKNILEASEKLDRQKHGV